MNMSPVTVIPTMPISQIYILFHVLHPDKIYVAKRNQLVGVIDEQILLERERLERKGGNKDKNEDEDKQDSDNNKDKEDKEDKDKDKDKDKSKDKNDQNNNSDSDNQEDYRNIDIH